MYLGYHDGIPTGLLLGLSSNNNKKIFPTKRPVMFKKLWLVFAGGILRGWKELLQAEPPGTSSWGRRVWPPGLPEQAPDVVGYSLSVGDEERLPGP